MLVPLIWHHLLGSWIQEVVISGYIKKCTLGLAGQGSGWVMRCMLNYLLCKLSLASEIVVRDHMYHNKIYLFSCSLSPVLIWTNSFRTLCVYIYTFYYSYSLLYPGEQNLLQSFQILRVATDGCRSRPWLACWPTGGASCWHYSQTLTVISV